MHDLPFKPDRPDIPTEALEAEEAASAAAAEEVWNVAYAAGLAAGEKRGRAQAAADLLAQIDNNPVPWSPDDVRRAAARLAEEGKGHA